MARASARGKLMGEIGDAAIRGLGVLARCRRVFGGKGRADGFLGAHTEGGG